MSVLCEAAGSQNGNSWLRISYDAAARYMKACRIVSLPQSSFWYGQGLISGLTLVNRRWYSG